MTVQQAAAEVRTLGALVGDVLELSDELRSSVAAINAKSEALRAALVASLPRLPGESDYARGVRMTRVQEALARITAPLRDFELRAGRELSDQQIGVTVREIESLLANKRT